jgi:hypothetical protein
MGKLNLFLDKKQRLMAKILLEEDAKRCADKRIATQR